MRSLLTVCVTALTLTAAGQVPLAAQRVASGAVDLSVGRSTGGGGPYFDRAGAAVDLTLAHGFSSPIVGAASVGWRGPEGGSDVCVLVRPGSTECREHFPMLGHLALLVGAGRTFGVLEARALGGPALFVGDGSPRAGAQLALDAGLGARRIALVAASRLAVLRDQSAGTLRLTTLAVGLRFRRGTRTGG